MLWIGLTGGIASGKSTVSRLLRDRGLEVIDADGLAREVVRRGTAAYQEIVEAFGPDVLLPDGDLNRKKIGELVFSDALKRALLEKITHPRIRALAEENRRHRAALGLPMAFYDVPLLFEKNMESLFDRVVVVACRREQQLDRLVNRDGLPKIEAERRLAAQLPIETKAAKADFLIRNDGALEKLAVEVDQCLAKLRALIHQAQT